MRWQDYNKQHRSAQDEPLDGILTHPPVVISKINTGTRPARFIPRNHTEFMVICRNQGVHPDGFLPNFNAVYTRISPSSSRMYNTISNVPCTPNRLLKPNTKSPMRLNELHPLLLCDVIETYTPPNARIFGLYAGTLTRSSRQGYASASRSRWRAGAAVEQLCCTK